MSSRFIVGLQGVRGFAILLIVISHCNWALNLYGQNIFRWTGAWGVSCFIMLSGFLAVHRYYDTSLSYKEVPRLLKNKIIKCYPLHFITLLIAIPVSITIIDRLSILEYVAKFFVNASLTQSWVPISTVYFSYNAVSWYLSLDVGLCLSLPFVLYLLRKMNSKQIVISIFLIICIETILVYITRNFENTHWLIYIFPVSRSLDYFVGGGIAVLARNNINNVWVKYINCSMLGAIFLGFLGIFLSMGSDSEIYSATVWVFPTAVLLFSVYRNDEIKAKSSLFTSRFFVFLGDISFELFLIHQLIIRYFSIIVHRLGFKMNEYIYIIAIFISIFVSVILNKMNNYKKKDY